MRTLPLFNDNMLKHIYDNFYHYFKYFDAYKYFITAILILLAFWLIVKFLFKAEYLPFFPAQAENKEDSRVNRMCAWGALVVSFALYVLRFLAEEQTVLNNFDSMNPGFMRNLTYGVLPVFKDWRFTPLSHIDGNIIFGVSPNYWVIGWFCVMKQIICLYLMYKCFYFVSKSKRIYLVALMNLVPAVFSVNNIVFPEQNIIITVLLSLIGLDKYQKTQKPRWLLIFLLSMNFAIYTKETIILFYAAYGLYLLAEAFITGRITLKKLKKPWLLITEFPVEFLLFVSAVMWVAFYYAVTPLLSNNRYLMTHYFEISELLRIYAVELVLLVIAVGLLVRKIYKKQFADFRLIMEGSVIGSVILSFYVVFWIKIAPSQDYPESYYLYLPAVFCIVYIFENIKQKSVQQLLAVLLVMGSLYQNYDFFINMQGAARHELVEFIASKAPKRQAVDNAAYPQGSSYMQFDRFLTDVQSKPMNIHFFSRQKIDTVFWKTTGWKVTLGLLLPDRNIVLKMDEFYKQFLVGGYAGLQFSYDQAVPGDYIIINKIFDANLPRLRTLVYENDVYAVYVVD